MNIRIATGATILAVSAGLALAACSSDAGDASPSASTSSSVADVATILDQVRTATECSPWVGGKQAGEGILPTYSFTCDADGDGNVDTSLTVYANDADRDADLVTVQDGLPGAAVIQGGGYLIATVNADHLAALEVLGGEVIQPAS